MRDGVGTGDEARFEATLRDALRVEAQAVGVRVTGGEIHRRIAARRRERRFSGGFLVALAAVVVVAIGASTLPGLFKGPAASAPAGGSEAVTVREVPNDTGGTDLVVEAAAVSGALRTLGRIPDPYRAAGVDRSAYDAWRARYSPDGYLAVALYHVKDQAATSVVLVIGIAAPSETPVKVDVQGAPGMGWGPGGRLLVESPRVPGPGAVLVDAAKRTTASLVMPPDVAPATHFAWPDFDPTWTPGGGVVAMRSSAATFSISYGTLTLGDAEPSFVEGLPSTAWETTGLETFVGGANPSLVQATSSEATPATVGVASSGSAGTRPAETLYVAPSGDLLVGSARQATDALAGWFLRYDTAGALALVRVEQPGGSPDVIGLPWRAAESDTDIVGVAGDGTTVAVKAGSTVGLASRSGAVRTLPDGSRFAGWAVATEVPLRPGVETCGASSAGVGGALAAVAYGDRPSVARADMTPVTPAGADALPEPTPTPASQDSSWQRPPFPPTGNWYASDALRGTTLHTTSGAGMGIVIPSGSCAGAWSIDATPVTGASELVNPDAVGLSGRSVDQGDEVGLIGFTAPAAGDWIVRATVWFAAPGGGADQRVTQVLHLRVEPATPMPSPNPSATPGTLYLDPPGTGMEDQTLVQAWTLGGTGPASGPTVYPDPEGQTLRRGSTTIQVGCRGTGTLRLALTTVPPDTAIGAPAPAVSANAWTEFACGTDPRGSVVRTATLLAAGGENALLVDRVASNPGATPPAWSVSVSQPVSVACVEPTLGLLDQVTLQVASGSTRATTRPVLGAYRLKSGAGTGAGSSIAEAFRLPAIEGQAPWSSWELTLPAGLCAAGVELAQAAPNLVEDTNTRGTGTDPADIGSTSVPQPTAGDTVLEMTLDLVGPDFAHWSATFLAHAQVTGSLPSEPTAAPTVAPTSTP